MISNESNRKLNLFGWFPPESAAFLEKLIKEYNVKTVIEIGSFLGLSTAFFAEKCEHVVAIDPFVLTDEGRKYYPGAEPLEDDLYPQFEFNMQSLGLMNKIEVLKMTSEEASKKYKESADLIYIDGSHAYEDVLADINLWNPRAKLIICGDDYDENWPEVRDAVDASFSDILVNGRVWYEIRQ